MIKESKRKAHIYKAITVLSYLLTIFWLGLIFYLSGQVADVSNQLSSGITEKIIVAIRKIVPQSKLEVADLNHFIRKNAHFFAYLLLGLLTSNSLYFSWYQAGPETKLASWSKRKIWLLSWFFCLAYAMTDELHQYFVPGRGCQLRDILIDASGAAGGILLYLVLHRLFLTRKQEQAV